MPQEFTLPDLGEGVHEAEIQEIPVSVGDTVERDEIILVVETDKAAVEIPSPTEGEIQDIRVEAGDLVNVGDVLITFNGTGTEGDSAKDEAQADKKVEEKTDDDEEQQAQTETKVTAEQESDSETEQTEQAKTEAVTGDAKQQPVPAAPATRRLARELDVNLEQIDGSGPGGRVTRDDVQSYANSGEQVQQEEDEQDTQSEPEAREKPAKKEKKEEPSRKPASGKELFEMPDFTKWGEIERVALRSVRRVTARRMTQSWTNIPHVSHHDKADVTELDQLRQEYQNERGLKELSMMVFVMKAAVSALKNYPRFNASLDTDTNEMILKYYYHVGMAVDTERGLLVPVIEDVDRKSITQLANEVTEAAVRARAGETKLEEMRGGSFTITNVGPIGGTHFDPIINFPQSAILGMAQVNWEPVVRNRDNAERQIEPRYMLPLVLAFDHRLSDGAEAAHFMNEVIAMLEDPNKFILKMS